MPTVTHLTAPIVFLIIQFFLNLFIREILKFKNWYYSQDDIKVIVQNTSIGGDIVHVPPHIAGPIPGKHEDCVSSNSW
jgi:hypothetical protein